ncbi:MAG: hypothetical protein AAB864_02180 [Patescibacteria group bacterium]
MIFFKKIVALLTGSGEVGGFQKPNQQVLARQAQQQAAHDIGLAKEREQRQFEEIKKEEVARAKEHEERVEQS